ncbi:MAG: hypothetical protein JW869_02845 [Candidatus Omnitrophica bacterium]|nr:hypothetical protein [Candidatus Omnitrophota bacterium]
MSKNKIPYVILIAATLIFIFGVSMFLKLHGTPQRFPAEPWSVFCAIRFHYLPLFNFGTDAWDNFFKSWFATSHGINDFIYFYLVTGIYDFFKIPLSEANFYYALYFLGTLYLLLMISLGKSVFNLETGCLAAIVLSVSYHGLYSTHCLNHRMTTLFLQLLLFMSAFFYLKDKKSLLRRIFFSVMLCVSASMELFLFLPLVLFLEIMWHFHYESNANWKTAIKDLLRLRHLVLWIPAFLSFFTICYIWMRFRASNLGMFAYSSRAFPFSLANFSGFLNLTKFIKKADANIFITATLLFIAMFLVLLLFRRIRWHNPIFFFILAFLLVTFTNISTNRWKFYSANVSMGMITAYGFTTLFHFFRKKIKFVALIGCLAVVYIAGVVVLKGAKEYFEFEQLRYKTVKAYFSLPSLKAVGYYIREYGEPESTVFNLFYNNVYFDHSEYYYGKYVVYDNIYPKKNFSLVFYSPAEAKKKRSLKKDFDFYVTLKGYDKYKKVVGERFLSDYRKVADVYDQEEWLASIYSANPSYPYLRMEISEYNRLWDEKYANLEHIFEHGRFGIGSLIGHKE